MKKLYLYVVPVVVFLCVIWACTNKEINLVTNVELAFEQTNTEDGFVQESLPTTITITPEVFLPEFNYFFKYDVLEGQGNFTNENGESLAEGDLILLNKEQEEDTSFLLTLNYNPKTPGRHRVRVATSDNFEKSFNAVLNYNIKNLDIIWTATTPVTISPPNTAVPIDVILQNNSSNPDLTFEWSYRYITGTGTVQTSDGTGILSNNRTAIIPGTYLFNAFVNEEGTNTIAFEIEDSTGQIITREISFEVAIDALSDNTRITSFVIDGQEAVINGTTITLTLPQGTPLDQLAPSISIPERSMITPSSGIAQDFNNSVLYTVTAEDGITTETYEVEVTIEQVPVISVTASSEQLSLVVNDEETVSVVLLPENASNQTILWTSDDPSIAIVRDGVITALSIGTTTIRATAQENSLISDGITVEVTEVVIPLTDIELTPSSMETTVGEVEGFFSVLFTPNNATNQDVVWVSSDENLATVDTNGMVSALQAGEVLITATSSLDSSINSSATLLIQELTIPIESITATPVSLSMVVEDQITANVAIFPENATNPTVIWMSDNTSIATVTDGIITAISEGSTVIRVTSQEDTSINDTITIDIVLATVPATAIAINAPATTPLEGDDAQLSINFTPDNTTNREVTWLSSDETIATVNETGLVRTLQSGNVTITALSTNDANIRDQIILNIGAEAIVVTGVSVSPTPQTLVLTETPTVQLTPTITPANATNPNVSWDSGNTTVATVDANGFVTARAVGSAVITVTTDDGNITATATITVEDPVIAVSGVSVSPTSQTLVLTETPTVQLTPTITPGNATNSNVSWDSGNTTVATVDANGFVTARAAGSAVITVTTDDGNRTATATITVEDPVIAVTGVSIEAPATRRLVQGATRQLTATISPANATDRVVQWGTSNASIATVSNTGLVTAQSTSGNVDITVTTNDGGFISVEVVEVTTESYMDSVTGIYYGVPGAVVDLNAESMDGGSSESGIIRVVDKNGVEVINFTVSGDTIDYGGCEGNADESEFVSHPLTIPSDGELHFTISGSLYEVVFGTWSLRPDGPISFP